MKQENVFAYTETEYKDYPGFISINMEDGKLMVTVRSPEGGGQQVAKCELPAEEYKELTFKLAGLFTGNS